MRIPENLAGSPLREEDYAALEARWITRDVADKALLRRVETVEGGEMVGQVAREGHSYAGIAIPYLFAGDAAVRGYRLRRDNPDLEVGSDGKFHPRRKYMGAPGRGNTLYLPPDLDAAWLVDAGMPVVIVEGEFKTLALWRLAWHGLGDQADTPAFVPVGLQGVYSWRGKVGRVAGEHPGEWHDVKGPIPDLSRIEWDGRHVVILFDTNVEDEQGSGQVAQARKGLTRDLEARGAEVSWFRWPSDTPEGVNGIDDYLAQRGAKDAIRQLGKAKKVTRKRKTATVADAVAGEEWRNDLIRTETGGTKAILANAIQFLDHLDELRDMVSHDEFAVRVMALQGTPWNGQMREWGEVDDIRLAEYLQRRHCHVGKTTASEAVAAVAATNKFHPVREYLNKLQWDTVGRLDKWLSSYLGVQDSRYAQAVGAKWVISAVARVMEPGCQADHCLILVGPQGRRKSTALRILAGDEWFTDRVGDLSEKDSLQNIHGKWIVEFAELQDVIGNRAEAGAVKAFMTARVDRFRPPYERRPQDFPRQCVFAGSVNLSEFLKDETGGRRFWPVDCGEIDIAGLERDRNQLWAEALARYRAKETWYLDDPDVAREAAEEQAARYEPDPWDDLVWAWVQAKREQWTAGDLNPLETMRIVTEDILSAALEKGKTSWTQADKRRINRILQSHGMKPTQQRVYDGAGNQVYASDGKPLRERFWRWVDLE